MRLGQYSVSAAQPGLAVDRLAGLRTLFTPIEEQKVIVEQLGAALEKQCNLKGVVDGSIRRLTEYRATLITAAVTGKLNVEAKGEDEDVGRTG